MPSLKTFRLRIRSVQSTQKITKAMKMVAAAKLRRAQEQATAARPYAEAMDRILASLGHSFKGGTGPRLLAGTGSDKVHLLIVATGDRGLCGAFNSTIVREARRQIQGGGVKLDGEKLADPNQEFAGPEVLAGKVLQLGKKTFRRLVAG